MNLLMKGTSTVNGETKPRQNLIVVDEMYKVHLYNQGRTIEFSGYVPENFNFALSSSWAAPMDGISLGDSSDPRLQAANAALRVSGLSSLSKATTMRVWTQPSYLTIELPIFLDAYESTRGEVVNPMVQLLCTGAPSEVGTVLVPPGPVPSKEAVNYMMDAMSGLTGLDTKNLQFDDKEAFTLKIGKFFTMSPAVITNVSAAGDCAFEDGSGNPISADMMLTVESYMAVSRTDLCKWFGVPDKDLGLNGIKNVVQRATGIDL